jgi:hypothetical protein
MRWILRGRPGPGDSRDAELDAWLSQTWEAAAAAVGRVLDVPAGKEALLASSGLAPERPAEPRRQTRPPAHLRRRVTARPRWRLPVLAGGLTAAAAATAAAVLVLDSGQGAVPGQQATAGHARTVVTTAWTVRQDADGTVTIYLRQYADPAGLQQTLRADGISAIVRSIPYVLLTVFHHPVAQPTCQYAITDRAPLKVQDAVWTGAGQSTRLRPGTVPVRIFIIHPGVMPPGSALFLAFMANVPLKTGTGSMPMKPVVLTNDTVPACVPVPIKPALAPAPKPQPTFPPASKP